MLLSPWVRPRQVRRVLDAVGPPRGLRAVYPGGVEEGQRPVRGTEAALEAHRGRQCEGERGADRALLLMLAADSRRSLRLRRQRLQRHLRLTNGIDTNGAAAKVMNFDRLRTKVRPKKSLCQKQLKIAVTPSVLTRLSLPDTCCGTKQFPASGGVSTSSLSRARDQSSAGGSRMTYHFLCELICVYFAVRDQQIHKIKSSQKLVG